MLLSNTIVFFAKLSEKDKIVWMHVAYFLAFLICGMLVVFNGDYTSRMSALTLLDSMGADCLAMSYPKECLISPKYLVFQSQMTLFFIGYSIIFCVYSVIYHFSVIKF